MNQFSCLDLIHRLELLVFFLFLFQKSATRPDYMKNMLQVNVQIMWTGFMRLFGGEGPCFNKQTFKNLSEQIMTGFMRMFFSQQMAECKKFT